MIQFSHKKHIAIALLLVLSSYSSIYAWSAISGNPSSYNLFGSPGDNLSATVWNDTVRWLKIVSDNTRNVFSDGTNVSVGAAVGSNRFEVTGDVGIKGGSSLRVYRPDNASYGVINYSAGNTLGLGVAGSPNNLVIESTGNVGVGGSPSTDKFRVTATTANDGAVFSNGTRSVRLIPGNAGAGANNPIVAANDLILTFTAGSINTGNLSIAPWGSAAGGIRINNNGNVSIGSTTVSGSLKLDVEGTIGATQYCDQNGANCFTAASSTLSGAGTSGYVPRYNGASSLTAGTIQDNGANVGIGKAPSGSVRLDVNGKINANNYGQTAGSINTNSLEVGGASPNATNGDGTIFFHDHGDIAHQLRYTAGTLYYEGAGNGYGTSTVPNFQVGGSIFAGINGGGVAIGTSSITPGVKLDVLGETKLRGTQINNDAIEVSTYNSGNRWAYIDFHGDDTYTDFSLRLLRDNGGANGASWLQHRGTGPLYIYNNEAAPIRMSTSATERLTILGGGNIGLFNNNPVARFQIGNNVATGPMDNYNEYQILLYDSGTATSSYGIGIRGSTLLFNSASLTDFDVNGVNEVSISGTSLDLKTGNALRFFDADSSNFVAIKPAATVSSNVTWTLPATDGSANAVLATNGAGQLSWVGLGGGGNAKVVKKFPETKQGGTFYYNCVIMGDDSVKCWGYDGHGQVGDGNPSINKSFPQTVPLPGPVDKLYTNTGNVFALLKDGTVYGWGYNAGSYELGDGTTTNRFYPVRVGTLSGVVKLVVSKDESEVSGNSTCALTSAGALWCWGYNGYGQLGNNSTTTPASPVQTFTSGVADVYEGQGYYGGFCVKKTDNTTACWGYNGYGTVGDNTTASPKLVPTTTSGLTNVSKMVSSGNYPGAYGHRCAIKTDGTLWCWGNNSNGQLCLGDTTQRNVPTQVSSLGTSVVEVQVSLLNTWIIMSDGTARACGYNSYGQLGNGNTTQSNSPVTPIGVTGATAITHVGDYYGGWYISVCYLLNNGTIKCAGYNGNGQLGNDTTTATSTPSTVVGITNAVDIMGRNISSNGMMCALLSTGVMRCWGYNGHGQIGNGTASSMYIPQDVLF